MLISKAKDWSLSWFRNVEAPANLPRAPERRCRAHERVPRSVRLQCVELCRVAGRR
jgi:hypothetical protein